MLTPNRAWVGRDVGGYVLQELIGVGDLGMVWLATDLCGREVAIKLFVGSVGADLYPRARRVARLSHPNLVSVHDVGTIDGTLYVVMDYVDGVPIDLWVERDEPELPEIRNVLAEAARAIAAAHEAGIPHRNIKAANILRAADGTVRVTDTCMVIPPHPLKTAADDQDAFCSLIRLLFRGSPPGPLRAIVRRGMHPDPNRRYPSMYALADALADSTRSSWTSRITGPLGLVAAMVLARCTFAT